MPHFFEFVFSHWILSSLFLLLAGAIIWLEIKGNAGGIKQASSQDVVRLMNQEQALVFDVRPHADYAKGHIVGAKHLAPSAIEQQMSKLEKHKNTPIILVCGSGTQSPGLAAKFRKQGFAKMYCLRGGMRTWQSDHLPIVK